MIPSAFSPSPVAPPAVLVDDDATPSLSPASEPAPGQIINGKAVWTEAQIIANAERLNDKWAGVTPVVTYQFYDAQPTGFPSGAAFAPLTADERTLARQAFFEWGEVANITFVEAPDNGVYGGSTGRVSLFLNASAPSYEWGDTTTYTRGATGTRAALSSAEIEIQPSAINARKLFVGGYNFQAMMHEIGHSLGLPHPGDYNADGSTITYANSAAYYQDSNQYTIMSYFDATSTGASYLPPGDTASYSASTPLRDDIAAIQAIYGANMTTRTGDTVYGFNSNTDDPQAFDFTVNAHPIICIWDAGGNDTIDLSGSSYGINLDLHAGAFSDVMGMVGNLSIAYGVTIENAVGSSGNDVIVGNDVANVLKGGPGDDTLQGNGGDDTLDGGDGTDTAVYASASSNYDWWWNAATGTWTVDDGRTTPVDGEDTLVSIEKLQFSDKTVALATPSDSDLIEQAFARVLSTAPTSADTAFVAAEQAQHASGGETLAAVYADVAARAVATTAVATLSYEFFTGATPSKVGLDYLVDSGGGNADSLNSAYYQTFSLENRYINFAVNLGKLGDGSAAFTAAYGSLSLADATAKAYAVIFGTTPTADKVAAILNAPSTLPGEATRADYFAYYGQDGANGIGTKAAMVGYLLAEAVRADVGTYARSDDAYLTALAAGAPQHVDLVGVYGQPGFAYTGG